ncbi:MAG TPA: hypothetical protein VE987_17190 [Polyangiaceae bacterium]|nr:hypothetical protein [Polyangiaceae bacterium]
MPERKPGASAAGVDRTKAVYDSNYCSRLEVDDRGVGMLQKIDRKIEACAEEDPGIRDRWKSLIEFLAKFRPGPGPKKAEPEPGTGAGGASGP